MKRFNVLAIVLMMMLVFIGGCLGWGTRDGGRERHEGHGEHGERR